MEQSKSSAIRALTLEYKRLQEEPVEGFRVKLIDDSNMFDWEVAIFGPPNTIYQGGYFKAHMKFPLDYPYSPPRLRFITKFWHPNVYENGHLCISILHDPVSDPSSGEHVSERWNPAQNVRTILLSVISLLNEPNTSSPANVKASVMFKKWKDSKGEINHYEKLVRAQVEATKDVAEKDGVVVPITIEDYCALGQITTNDMRNECVDTYDADFYDEDYICDNYDDDDSDSNENEDEDSDENCDNVEENV